MVGSLVNGSLTLATLPPYRQVLFRDLAAAAGVNLADYENGKLD